MAENQQDRIIILLIEMIQLLEAHENKWALTLRALMKDYLAIDNPDEKKNVTRKIMQAMLGGMGSLSDVVLHKNKQPLIEENNRFDQLLDQLYDECKQSMQCALNDNHLQEKSVCVD